MSLKTSVRIQLAVWGMLWLTECSSSSDDGISLLTSEDNKWPLLDSACQWVNVDVSHLEAAPDVVDPQQLDPYYSGQIPNKTWPRDRSDSGEFLPGIVMHYYEHMTVMGHYFATGTFVYFVIPENEFYMWGDDWMSHLDGMVGPFSGNPMKEIPQAATVAEPPQGVRFESGECHEGK